ncbi:MAG: hypothetical protein OXH00_03045 [Candidatus Poribacteria bacterium]|nr:hypothetical protein [Candidatus Poribacteria bacterium]
MAAQEKLKQLIDEAFDEIEQLYQARIDAAHAKIEELEAKARLQTESETDARIRELAAREQMSVEAWLKREIKHAAEFADMPFIRVHPDFYERLKAHAIAKGVMPEFLTTTHAATRYFQSLIDNGLLNERELD